MNEQTIRAMFTELIEVLQGIRDELHTMNNERSDEQ